MPHRKLNNNVTVAVIIWHGNNDQASGHKNPIFELCSMNADCHVTVNVIEQCRFEKKPCMLFCLLFNNLFFSRKQDQEKIEELCKMLPQYFKKLLKKDGLEDEKYFE